MINSIVKTETELRDCFKKVFLSVVTVPRFDFREGNSVTVKIDGKQHVFRLVFRLNPSKRDVEHIGNNLLKKPVLLASVKLSYSIIEHCKRLNVNCADLSGRIWIRDKGLLIDKNDPELGGTFGTDKSGISFFHRKSSRLSRILLSTPERIWSQDDLAANTGISQGLLSRLLRYASTQGWVDGRRGDWKLSDFDGLLDAWVKDDNWKKRVTVRQYSALDNKLKSIASRLVDTVKGKLAFTQWFAAKLRFPYTDMPLVSAYRESFLDDSEQSALGLRSVDDGGNLWIIIPNDEGVFQFLNKVDGFPIACDIQIYLDLLQVGLRGPDQAVEFRKWKGFCKT